MKRLILITGLFALFSFSAKAQLFSVDYGAKLGLNLANLSGVEGNNSIKPGFHAGLFTELGFGSFAIQPEVVYSIQGTQEKIDMDEASGTVKVNLGYVNFPVMAKYYIADGFNIQAGPQLGILATAKTKFSAKSGGEDFSESEDIKDEIKSTDIGASFGLGYKVPLVGLQIDARYNLGLTDINAVGGDGDAIKNNVIQLSVGYRF